MPDTPTMTQQQVYDIIQNWITDPALCYDHWKDTYNWLPPHQGLAASSKWQAAGQIAAVYTGPVIT